MTQRLNRKKPAEPAGNPALPRGTRTPRSVVTEQAVERLTRAVVAAENPTVLSTRAPWTGEPLAELPESTPRDVERAFDTARAAQPVWAARPVRERAAVLLRLHDLLLTRQDEALDLIQAETGKTRLHAHEEVLAVAVAARHYGRRAPRYLAGSHPRGVVPVLTSVREEHRPKGVVGQVSPWNYPLELLLGDALPALVAGNALVSKPDTQTALTALWARELAVAAGVPAELWQIVVGEGPVIGPAVVEHADYVSFTGSTRTGRDVARRAADRLVGASLELGGKNAMIVLDDVDLDRAVAGALRACFSSAGQLCISIERLLVDRRIYPAFRDRFVAAVGRMRLGAGFGYGADMGSLVSERQLETVTRHVEEAREKGAAVLTGGRHRPDVGPLFYEPTVLEGVTQEMAMCADETFGPVVALYQVSGEEDAVTTANATAYGLNSSVWTSSARRGRRVAARLRTGTVNINEGYAAAYGSAAAPMGGMGDSGLGRRHGAEGVRKYTESQTIAVQRLLPLAPSFGMSDERYARTMTTALRALKAMRLS